MSGIALDGSQGAKDATLALWFKLSHLPFSIFPLPSHIVFLDPSSPPPTSMHSVKTAMLLLTVLVASASSTTAAVDVTTRHLRGQHNGEDHSQPAVLVAPAPVTNTANAAAPAAKPTTTNYNPASTTTTSTGTASSTVSVTPGSATNNIQVNPGSVITPASASASAPVVPAPAAAATTQPGHAGMSFGSLNPLTMVATLAHGIHGAILGHTNTLSSAYMQSHPGGGH